MDIEYDIRTITEAGFDEYLIRSIMPEEAVVTSTDDRYVDANSIVGGIIGEEGIIYLGSKQIRIDGKRRQIIINDGVNDRVIIGYLD